VNKKKTREREKDILKFYIILFTGKKNMITLTARSNKDIEDGKNE